ncbi:MAG: polymer-forming cytoskeletal protein [Verrucomicrobiota bacterium]
MNWNVKIKEVLPLIKKEEDSPILISEGMRLEGKLAFNHSGHFAARLVGNVKSKHHIVFDKCSKVEGEIRVGSCEILGHCIGKVSATGDVTIKPSAKVRGVCRAKSVVVPKGAEVEVDFDIGPQSSMARWVKQTTPDFIKK